MSRAPASEAAPVRITRWFADLPGFGVRDYAKGGASFIVQTRMKGRVRTVTIGKAAVIAEADARQIARHLLLRAQTGENPADARAKARATPSYADFLAAYWQRMEQSWKPTTRASHSTYRRLYLEDAFPGYFIDEIETADVLRWFVRTTEIAGPGGANQCLVILAAIMGKAEAWGEREEGTNPCRDIRRNRPRRFQRFLSAEEMQRLGRLLDLDAERRPAHAAVIRVLALTGCRRSEILGLEWKDIRGERVHLRDGKTGSRIVWLGADARAALASLPRIPGIQDIFYDVERARRIPDIGGYWRSLIKRAEIRGVRLHDLRHSFASHAARSAETLPMIGKLLGHRKVGSTSRYAHLDDAHLSAIAQSVGCEIDRLLRISAD